MPCIKKLMDCEFFGEQMNNRVFLIKPCRLKDEMPIMPKALPAAKVGLGEEVCAVLDLNILNRFKEYLTVSIENRSPLLLSDIEEIKEILNIPGMFVCAGFALNEADEAYLQDLIKYYESFFSTELTTYVDAPNFMPPDLDRIRARKFRLLPTDDQNFLSFTYLSLLKVHDILISEKNASPEAKFDLYLEYMDGVADFVPGLETEVAKHCFFRATGKSGDDFFEKSRAISANFDKGGRGENRIDRILNGARDIMYIRSAAAQDGKSLDGRVQDAWLLTCDSGIAALCALFYFCPTEGERSKFTTLTKNQTRQTNSYWRYVDKTFESINLQRYISRADDNYFCSDNHQEKIRNLAAGLSEALSSNTIV